MADVVCLSWSSHEWNAAQRQSEATKDEEASLPCASTSCSPRDHEKKERMGQMRAHSDHRNVLRLFPGSLDSHRPLQRLCNRISKCRAQR